MLSAGLRRELAADGAAPAVDEGPSDPLNRVLLLDMRLYLENDILVKLDRASMMASLEGRVPLLNNDFVSYAMGLPLRMKLRGLQSKFLLKRALARSAAGRHSHASQKGVRHPRRSLVSRPAETADAGGARA